MGKMCSNGAWSRYYTNPYHCEIYALGLLHTLYGDMQVIFRARESAKVPPSLVVISRVRQFRLHRDKEGGYGITLRGNCPVFIRSVDFLSPARQAGIRSGDLLLEVNGRDVRHSSKLEVLELLRGSGDELSVMVIAGGLDWSPLSTEASLPTSTLTQSQKLKNSTKYHKAAEFHNKVDTSLALLLITVHCCR